MNFKKILLIDDSDLDSYINKKIMERVAFAEEMQLFNDAQEALHFLTSNLDKPENLPGLIFLDINMPVMNGFEFLAEFQKLTPHSSFICPVVMLSSSIDPADKERAKEFSSVYTFLQKPFSKEELCHITPEQIFAHR